MPAGNRHLEVGAGGNVDASQLFFRHTHVAEHADPMLDEDVNIVQRAGANAEIAHQLWMSGLCPFRRVRLGLDSGVVLPATFTSNAMGSLVGG